MITLRKNLLIAVVVILFMTSANLFAGVTATAHDFSPSQDGSTACQYCHTPHMALSGTPLWSHKLSNITYEIYWSSSLDAEVGQPTGSSKLCLSCHDGTVALQSSVNGRTGSTFMEPGSKRLGTDLSDDHPISFVYSDELVNKDPQLKSPEQLPEKMKLDSLGELQCSTCHDPHNDAFGDFLVVSNVASNLCMKCHDIDGWATTFHATSTSLVKDADDDYLRQTGYTTVKDNGCQSCHRTHSAEGPQRLFHFKEEENNCLSCHNGRVAVTNLVDEFNKASGHFVNDYESVHDIKESATNSDQHVECADCHNPHMVTSGTAQAPLLSGALKGVSGVTAEGSVMDEAINEYEVCFKCHGNNPNRVDTEIFRQIYQTNTLMEFDRDNPSFHPVTAPGANSDVPSLIAGMDEATIIYCTDCHSSDSSSEVKGPHGSIYPHILAYQYETADETEEDFFAYELCYQCHDRESILNDDSFKWHNKHLKDKIPCSACHDPHGISSVQGNSINNSNLINFDTSMVFPDPDTGILEFEDTGIFSGSCYLYCHDKKHSPKTYQKN
jgi:predicted CXXCH cytochrome family protein